MARTRVDVTYRAVDQTRIPDALTEGASILLDLSRRGVVDEIGARLKIRRQGGFSAVDVWLLLLVFFAAGVKAGVRGFWETLRPHVGKVAAVAGRRRPRRCRGPSTPWSPSWFAAWRGGC